MFVMLNYMSNTIGQRFKSLRDSRGFTQSQISDKTGLSITYISKFENDDYENPRKSTIESMAKALGVHSSDILYDKNDLPQNIVIDNGKQRPPNAVDAPRFTPNDIPVVGLAKAGRGGFFGEDCLPVQDWSKKVHRPESITDPHAYAIIIEGDSMEPMASKGDMFLCETNKSPKNGDRVVVQKNDGEVMAKLFYDDGKHIVLKSMNQKYEPIVLARDEIRAVHVVRWVKYK